MEKPSELEQMDPWSLYIYAMKAPMTRDRYQTRLAKFLDFIGMVGITLEEQAKAFAKTGKDDINWSLNGILKFVQFQKDRVNKKETSGATVRNYVKSIKLFCEMADMPIPWKKITRGLPKGKKYADDRIPTLEEIKKVVQYPDRRIKAIIYTMSSSGIRIGAWDYLQWGHIRLIETNGKIVAAKMIVYAGEDEEYFTFISPEAWRGLKEWMSYRETSGESIRRSRKKRHPYQANHSLRKWFKTRCEIAGMKPINIEKLMNHSVGISDSYYSMHYHVVIRVCCFL